MRVDKRIHILHVSKSTGGVGQYLRMLTNKLDKNHFKITVVCLSESGENLAAELAMIEGVEALSIPMERFKIDPVTDAKVWWQLLRIIRKGKFDIIHAHTSKPGFLARTASVGTGIPTIYRPAGFAFHDGIPRWKALSYATIERIVASMLTTKIMAVCNDERELAMRYHVGSESKLVTIYTGVDANKYALNSDRKAIRESLQIPESAFLVGTVGRLTKAKAPSDFVNAAALVHKEYPDIHFLWVGDGELNTKTQALARSLGIEHIFHFAGHRNDVDNVLPTMDCFVLSSHWEGFSIAVLEAMAAGLPVISSRVSGAGEAIVDGETGYLVPVGGVTELANAIITFASNPELVDAFGKAGQLRIKQFFTLDSMVRAIESLYFDLAYQKTMIGEQSVQT